MGPGFSLDQLNVGSKTLQENYNFKYCCRQSDVYILTIPSVRLISYLNICFLYLGSYLHLSNASLIAQLICSDAILVVVSHTPGKKLPCLRR